MFPIHGKRMLELGNKKNREGTYKEYFENAGMEHISIDWNGLDGAIKLDLRQPIDMEPFDMVTNIGTTEHVDDQYGVWQNIHNLTKVGGVIVSHTPLEGDWWWHGEYYPRKSFFEQFTTNGYDINYMEVGQIRPSRVLNVRMKKYAHNNFIMPGNETMYHNIQRPK